MAKNTKKKKSRFSKIIVLSVISLNIIFAVSVLLVFLKTGCEPTGLVASWFSFTTIELWSLAGIKKTKEKNSGGEE